MTKEDAVTMIGFQGVYEIDYQKDNIVRTWHISDMELIKGYGGKVIAAFCHEPVANNVYRLVKRLKKATETSNIDITEVYELESKFTFVK